MSGVEHIEVAAASEGMRLDRWFRERYPPLTQGRLQKLLRSGQVRVDGARAKANQRLQAGQQVRVPPLGLDLAAPPPRKRPSDKDADFARSLVIYRDDQILVLNKPSGLAVQGGSKTERHLDMMLDALTFDAKERPRLVHRLDRDTSGVLLLARSRKVASDLSRLFRTRSTRKIYWALAAGVPRPQQGKISVPLKKQAAPGDGERVRPAEEGDADAQKAVTYYSVVAKAGELISWVSLKPVTGRTHQLRAHLAHIGNPVVGDTKYGRHVAFPTGEIPDRLHLHARRLTLPHPAGGTLDVTAPLPGHMVQSWRLFGFDPDDASAGAEVLEA